MLPITEFPAARLSLVPRSAALHSPWHKADATQLSEEGVRRGEEKQGDRGLCGQTHRPTDRWTEPAAGQGTHTGRAALSFQPQAPACDLGPAPPPHSPSIRVLACTARYCRRSECSHRLTHGGASDTGSASPSQHSACPQREGRMARGGGSQKPQGRATLPVSHAGGCCVHLPRERRTPGLQPLGQSGLQQRA